MTDIREEVSKAYSDAIRRNQEKKQTATAPACCCSAMPTQTEAPDDVAVAAQTAGYTEEADRYGDAADSSFGCGNPLAFSEVRPGDDGCMETRGPGVAPGYYENPVASARAFAAEGWFKTSLIGGPDGPDAA